MGKPDAPTPPNPYATAQAQTGTNVSTAIANAMLGHINQVTPTGNLDYNQSGNYNWTDPTSGSVYNIPTFTATQTLTDQGKAIQNQNLGAQYNLAGLANSESGNIAQLLNTPFNPSASAPASGQASSISGLPAAQTSFASGGPIQNSLGNYGQAQTSLSPYGSQQTSFDTSGLANPNAITGSYGPQDLGGFTQNVQQAMMGQISPQLDIQKQQLQQQLADQGIRYGSQAYNNAFTPFNAQENNAYLQTVTGATAQANQLMNMMGQQAGFQNQAQQQAYNQQQGLGQFANQAQQANYQQALGAGTFANAGQQQAYEQALGAGGFANQAQSQLFQQNAAQGTFNNAGLAQQSAQAQAAFNAANAQRSQYMQEQYAQRNQPINEITSLLGQTQVANPALTQTGQNQIPTTDIAGLINSNFNQQMQNYQQASQNYNSLTGGILGLGAGALKLSDRRIKDVDHKIATVFAADEDGTDHALPIYKYSYKDDPSERKYIGPMAQDVEKINPQHVTTVGGRKFIKPQQVMGSILRAG